MFSRIAVVGNSMEPALHSGDWLVFRRTRRLRPGCLAVVRHPNRPDLVLVKRAVRSLPDGSWWVLGDNPTESDDSRAFGPVSPEEILGRVVLRYRSGEH